MLAGVIVGYALVIGVFESRDIPDGAQINEYGTAQRNPFGAFQILVFVSQNDVRDGVVLDTTAIPVNPVGKFEEPTKQAI